eukprot:COSAG06_NODE_14125_length_1187_cov_1.245404_1_plen_46_part_10
MASEQRGKFASARGRRGRVALCCVYTDAIVITIADPLIDNRYRYMI